MSVITYTSLNAKNQFGKLLDDAQQSLVSITKHNRPVGVLLSVSRMNKIADNLLSEPLKKSVKRGDISILEAIDEQTEMDSKINSILQDVDAGNYSEPDEDFYQRIRLSE